MLQDTMKDLTEGLTLGLPYEYLTDGTNEHPNKPTWEPVFIKSLSLFQVELIPFVETGKTKYIDRIPFGPTWPTNSIALSISSAEKRLRRKEG